MSSRHEQAGSSGDLEVSVPVATVWTTPDAPRDLDLPAVLDSPELADWTAAMDTPVRRQLGGRTLTQLLLGEPVKLLEDEGNWVRVVAPAQPSSLNRDGYPGWVRRAHLDRPARDGEGTSAVVTTPTARGHLDGASLQLSFGTDLPVARMRDRSVEVNLPGDRSMTMSADDLTLHEAGGGPSSEPEALLSSARAFVGLHYLWGGTSGWGLDCSGLVHLVFRAHGLVVPRDAHDQAAASTEVPLDEVRPGDLFFFARREEIVTHVGFASRPATADGVRWMLHAPEGGALVEEAPMAPHRSETLVGAGRWTERMSLLVQ